MARVVQLPAPGRGGYDRALTRPERDAEHRARLIQATAEVFLEGKISVARVIERAGVGRSTFYEFFDSPEHVLAHLEQRALRALHIALGQRLGEARTPLERVRALLRAWLAWADEDPLDARVLLARRGAHEILSPAGKLLHESLERSVQSAQLDRIGGFGASELAAFSAVGAVEVLTRVHLESHRIEDAQRVFSDAVTKLLR